MGENIHKGEQDISAGGDVNLKGNIDEHSYIYIWGKGGNNNYWYQNWIQTTIYKRKVS